MRSEKKKLMHVWPLIFTQNFLILQINTYILLYLKKTTAKYTGFIGLIALHRSMFMLLLF